MTTESWRGRTWFRTCYLVATGIHAVKDSPFLVPKKKITEHLVESSHGCAISSHQPCGRFGARVADPSLLEGITGSCELGSRGWGLAGRTGG